VVWSTELHGSASYNILSRLTPRFGDRNDSLAELYHKIAGRTKNALNTWAVAIGTADTIWCCVNRDYRADTGERHTGEGGNIENPPVRPATNRRSSAQIASAWFR